jgi:hypothetical protein
MRKITILKGFQKAINQFPYITNTKQLVKQIRFDSSCVYAIGKENQQEWNTLMGFTYGLMPTKKPNSVSFCWRYNPETNKIEVGPLYYLNGFKCVPQNSFHSIYSLDLDKDYLFSIYTHNNLTILMVGAIEEKSDYTWKFRANPKKYGWIKPLCFNSKKKAPHTIQVEQERIR